MEQTSIPTPSNKRIIHHHLQQASDRPRLGLSHRKKGFIQFLARGLFYKIPVLPENSKGFQEKA
jgi:hypothetical protein